MQSEGQVTEIRQRFSYLNWNKGQEVNDSVARLVSTYSAKFPTKKNHQLQQSPNGLLSVHSCPTIVCLPERTFLLQTSTEIPSMAIYCMAHQALHYLSLTNSRSSSHALLYPFISFSHTGLIWSLEHSKSCSCLSAFSAVIPLDCVPVLCCRIINHLTI